MGQSKISTEAQQIVLNLLIDLVSDASEPLFMKKQELELLEKNESIEFDLMAINLRLDLLGKIQANLIEPVKAYYVEIESFSRHVDSNGTFELQKPSELLTSVKSSFIDSVMQGLK